MNTAIQRLKDFGASFIERQPGVPFERVHVCSVCGLWPRRTDESCPDCNYTDTILMAQDQIPLVVGTAKMEAYKYEVNF